jgi:uncharacterized membrane protein YkoI
MVNKVLMALMIAAGIFAGTASSYAKTREWPAPRADVEFELAQSQDAAISPGEAADIAQSAVPGSRVLKVKLLPSGVYAVTLKTDDRVERVMVDAQSGAVQ